MSTLKNAVVRAGIRVARIKALEAAKTAIKEQIKALKLRIAMDVEALEGKKISQYYLSGRIAGAELKRRFLEGSAECRAEVAELIRNGSDERYLAGKTMQYLKAVNTSDFQKLLEASRAIDPVHDKGKRLESAYRHFVAVYHSLQSHYSTEFLGKVATRCGQRVPTHSNGKYLMSPDILVSYLHSSDSTLSNAAYVFLYTNAQRYSREYNLTNATYASATADGMVRSIGNVEFRVEGGVVYAYYYHNFSFERVGMLEETRTFTVKFSTALSPVKTYGKEYYQYVAEVVEDKGRKMVDEQLKRIGMLDEYRMLTFTIKEEFENDSVYTAYSESDDWNIDTSSFVF